MKGSEEDTAALKSDSEDQADPIFQGIEATPQHLLTKHYDPARHSLRLINYVWRCHHAPTVQAHYIFQQKHHPNLQPPKISSLYPNSAFIEDLSKILEQNNTLPGPFIGPVPNNFSKILDQIFEKYGCVPNLERFLIQYPVYLQKHLVVEHALFESGKLDPQVAYFLAFCGAAQKESVYMMVRYFRQFQRVGGDNSWVTQGKFPKKYQCLLKLNRLMAKALWLVDQESLASILESSGCHWSKMELALAVEILAFAHQNAAIALAMGLLAEEPLSQCSFFEMQKVEREIQLYQKAFSKQCNEASQKLDSVIPFLKVYQEEQDSREKGQGNGRANPKKSFGIRKSEGEEEVVQYMKKIGQQLADQNLCETVHKYLQPLLGPYHLVEKRKDYMHPPVDSSEYNFTFMAYPVLNNLTHNIADHIHDLIHYSQVMTRDNFGNNRISSTKEFRKAMRYYAQNLCGYRHYEYNFKAASALLTMALKFYIRLVALSPVHINRQVIREVHHESGRMECFDLGHVAVLIANTKLALELTLVTRALQAVQLP